MDILRYLKPLYWFSAHLHVKFPALYEHGKGQSSSGELESSNCRQFTKFLSLDKCLPRRSYLQIVDVTMETVDEMPYKLAYDPEWLAILRSTEQLMSYDNSRWIQPLGKWHVNSPVKINVDIIIILQCFASEPIYGNFDTLLSNLICKDHAIKFQCRSLFVRSHRLALTKHVVRNTVINYCDPFFCTVVFILV